MKKNNMVINTLVFLEELKNGVKQSKLIRDIHSLGICKVEVRREFIRDFKTELNEILDVSSELQVELYYSVPEYLYVKGEIAIGEIEEYFREAHDMNCRNVKLNIGDYNDINLEDATGINALCDRYSINLTIENDQTPENGRVEKIKKFLELSHELGTKISATFDIGNWLWQGQDPISNAYLLKPYVSYIHLKDVKIIDRPQAAMLDEGIIPWRSILGIFDMSIPVAIEYPCYPDALKILKGELDKLEAVNLSGI